MRKMWRRLDSNEFVTRPTPNARVMYSTCSGLPVKVMKILYIGHTYTVRANHAKIAALARLPDVHVTLVTPHGWRGPLYNNVTDMFEGANNVEHKVLRAAFIGSESGYCYGPSLFTLIARLKPDIVHVEQGAWALSY